MEDPSSPSKSSEREDPSSQNKSPATLPQSSSSHRDEEEGVDVKVAGPDSSKTSSSSEEEADHDSSLPSSQSLKDEKKDPPTHSSSSSEHGEEDDENVEEKREKDETVEGKQEEEEDKEEGEIDESLPLVHFLNPTQIRKLERMQRKGKKPNLPVSPDQDVAVPSGSRPQETGDQQKSPANVATSDTKAQGEEDNENVEEERDETVEGEEEHEEEEDKEEQNKEEEEFDESLPIIHLLSPAQISKLERRQRKGKKPSSLVSPDQDVAVPSGSRPQETEDQQKSPAGVATSETKAQEEEQSFDEADGSEESQPKPRHPHMSGRLDPDSTDSGSSEEGSSQPLVSYKPPLKKAKEDYSTNKGD